MGLFKKKPKPLNDSKEPDIAGYKELRKIGLRMYLDLIQKDSSQDKQEIKTNTNEEFDEKKLTASELKELEQLKKEIVEILEREKSSIANNQKNNTSEYNGRNR